MPAAKFEITRQCKVCGETFGLTRKIMWASLKCLSLLLKNSHDFLRNPFGSCPLNFAS